jgi:hypothetical protein
LEILDRTEKQLVAAESATDLKNCCIGDFGIEALAVFSILALLDKRQILKRINRRTETAEIIADKRILENHG